MEKNKLQSFINRYYLAGNCEAVILKENQEGVGCELIDMDQTVVGKLQWKTTPFMQGELGINHTGSLIKMLSAVGDNINIDVQSSSGKNYAMKISEGSTKATFMLADTTVIPAVPSINAEPPYEVTIDIDDEFVNKFIKAKNALPESDNFAVQCTNGETNIVINYSSINTNRINFKVDANSASDFSPICFSAKIFKEILLANDGAQGTLEISSKGLARVTFTNSDYSSTYYLVKLTIS